MSVTAQTHVWKHSRAKGSALLVLLAIADYAHDDGTNAWPKLEALAEKTRMTERSMRTILGELVALGELRIRENVDRREVKGGYVPRRFMDVLCVPVERRRTGKDCRRTTGKDFRSPENSKEIAPENGLNFGLPENISGDLLEESSASSNQDTGKIFPTDRKNSAPSPEESRTPLKEDPSGIRQDPSEGERRADARPTLDAPQELVDLWNLTRFPGPCVMELSPDRERKYQRALEAKPLRADWARAIVWLNAQRYANAPGGDDHGTWRASLDWLAKPGQLAKVLEQAQVDAGAPRHAERRHGRAEDNPWERLSPQQQSEINERRRRAMDFQREQDARHDEAAALVLELSDAARKVLEADVLPGLEPFRDRMSASLFDEAVCNALPRALLERARDRTLVDVVAELEGQVVAA